MVIAEMEPPYKILEHGRGGKYNRIRMLGVYTLQPSSGGGTRVEYTFETEPSQVSDKLMENLIVRSWTKRKAAKAMRRLRAILDDNAERGERASYEGE